ncbi:MAG: hypothetical protein EBY22_01600 [Gammaproteobacteria bacterium]|nr:hypothetical protein [Gammaproteobacteria bacterium]
MNALGYYFAPIEDKSLKVRLNRIEVLLQLLLLEDVKDSEDAEDSEDADLIRNIRFRSTAEKGG